MALKEKVVAVQTNVRVLISLDPLDKYGFYVINGKNVLCCTTIGVEIQLKRKHGRVFLQKSNAIFCTSSELAESHNNFPHSPTNRLFNLLKLATPRETNAKNKQILEEI